MAWLTGKQYMIIAAISLALVWLSCIFLLPGGGGILGSIILLVIISMFATPLLFLAISIGWMIVKYIRRSFGSHT